MAKTKSIPRARGNPSWKPGVSGNPRGRPKAKTDAVDPDDGPKTIRQFTEDGWVDFLTGMGKAGTDKRVGARFYSDIVTYVEARELYRGDPLGARIVEAPVDDMLREPFEFCVSEDAEGNDEEYGTELAKQVSSEWERLKLVEKLHQAVCYMRAYGGAAILIGANDGSEDLAMPLRTDAVFEVGWLTVLEPREIQPLQWYTDARAPNIGQPELYVVTPITIGAPALGQQLMQSVMVHESRLAVFDGVRVTREVQMGTYGMWGDSVFTRVQTVLRDFNISWAAAGNLVVDFSAAVLKIQGLARMMEKDNKQLFQQRMAGVAMSMSHARAVLIDKDEEYTRTQTPVTGLPDLLALFCKLLAAAAGVPVSVLFGESPGGLNASGASSDQMRLYYDRCAAGQAKWLLPAIRKITEVILATIGGVPDHWTIEFAPLWTPSQKEEVETRKLQMEIDTGYFNMGALTGDQIARARFGGRRFSYETRLEREATAKPGSPDPAEATPEELAAYEASKVAAGAAPAPAVSPVTGAATDVQQQALNGAQTASMIEVVSAVADRKISRQSGKRILMRSFQMPEAEAEDTLGPDDFEPAKPAPPPGLGGGFPPKPNAPIPPPAPAPPKEPAEQAAEGA